jgi:hypothetical protein
MISGEQIDDPMLQDMRKSAFDFIAELSAAKPVRDMLTEQRGVLRRENEALKRELEQISLKLLHAEGLIKSSIEWMEEDGCDCGVGEEGTCSLCLAKEWLKNRECSGEEESTFKSCVVDKNWFKGGSGLEKGGEG